MIPQYWAAHNVNVVVYVLADLPASEGCLKGLPAFLSAAVDKQHSRNLPCRVLQEIRRHSIDP